MLVLQLHKCLDIYPSGDGRCSSYLCEYGRYICVYLAYIEVLGVDPGCKAEYGLLRCSGNILAYSCKPGSLLPYVEACALQSLDKHVHSRIYLLYRSRNGISNGRNLVRVNHPVLRSCTD